MEKRVPFYTALLIMIMAAWYSCNTSEHPPQNTPVEDSVVYDAIMPKKQELICSESVFLNTDSFPGNDEKEFSMSNVYSSIDSYPEIEQPVQEKLNCQKYYANKTFSRDFYSFILFREPECADCRSSLILFNISKNTGCIIDKIEISTDYSWEMYKSYHQTIFNTDSSFTRTCYYAGNKETESGDYSTEWIEKIISSTYKINSEGHILLDKSDTATQIFDHKFL